LNKEITLEKMLFWVISQFWRLAQSGGERCKIDNGNNAQGIE